MSEHQSTVTAVVVGAGSRGSKYSQYSIDFPDRLKIAGVAEVREFHRTKFQQQYNIPADHVFTDYKDLINVEKLADCAIIATQDRQHKEPAIALAKKGYHILVEKPLAITYADCVEITEACRSSGVILAVCHVLRYTPQAKKIRELIESGAIGDVVNIQHLEPIGFWHFAHSFVRGNWRKESESTFCLLAKSCHDLDLISCWMGSTKCVKISSFGSLKHFKKENKPKEAGTMCVDCAVEAGCPYSAKKVYLDLVKKGHTGWPVKIIADVADIENVTSAIRHGPYGRCVYECDNDVVDNQVVNMEFECGATASFTMVAFTESVCERKVRVFGTQGEIRCDFADLSLAVEHYDFKTRKTERHLLAKAVPSDACASRLTGHGGADFYAMDAFVSAVRKNDASLVLTGPEETLRSHLLCFQAERSRLTGNVVLNPEKEPFDGSLQGSLAPNLETPLHREASGSMVRFSLTV